MSGTPVHGMPRTEPPRLRAHAPPAHHVRKQQIRRGLKTAPTAAPPKAQSLRLKHGWGRDIDNVHEAIVRLDHRGSFLLWPCGKALRDHHKVPAYVQGPSRTPCGTRTLGASAYTQQARTPMYRARGAAILHAEEPSPRCERSVPRVEGGVPRRRRGVCDALHRSTVLPHNGNCRCCTSRRSSVCTIAP